MNRNTISFDGDNNKDTAVSNNIKKIDDLVLKMCKSVDTVSDLEKTGVLKLDLINSGKKKFYFNGSVDDNIRKIDELIQVKLGSESKDDVVSEKKVINRNTISFDKPSSDEGVDKKRIKRGKINIKDSYISGDTNDVKIDEPSEVKVTPILTEEKVQVREFVDLNNNNVDDAIEKVIDDNISQKHDKFKLLLSVMLGILIVVLIAVFVLLYMVASGNA